MKPLLALAVAAETLIAYLLSQAAPSGPEGWLPFVGNVAGVLVMALLAFRYLEKRDAAMKAMTDEAIGRIERMEAQNEDRDDKFLVALREVREDNNRVTVTVFELSRETISTLNQLAGAINAVSDRMERIERDAHRLPPAPRPAPGGPS